MQKPVRIILIVDDRFENRYLLQAMLEGNGYQILSAENGRDALDIIKKERVDAIISDILMPEMDGFKLCRSIRDTPEYAHIPFIFYTASYTEEKDRNFGLSLGADAYIIKPVEPEEFMAIVREVFSSSKGERISHEKEPFENQISFYSSYSEIIENKLSKKLVELDEQKETTQFNEEKSRRFYIILQGIGYLVKAGTDLPLSFEGQVAEITGYQAEEFRQGRIRWVDLLHPDDKTRYLLEKKNAESRSGSLLSIQYRIIHKDGEPRWVHEIASVFPGREPDSIMIQGAVYDNTRQIKYEEQIRRSEEHYRFLFETMAEGAIFQDKTGIIIDANPSAERILGLPRDQILGRTGGDPIWKMIKEDFSPYPTEEHPNMVALMTGKETSAIMGVANPRDNQYHWILTNAVPIFPKGEDTPYQVFTTFVDITSEQIAKHALFIREKQYRELVECLSDTLFTLNKGGEFTYVSPMVRKNFGYEPSEIIGHDYRDGIHPDDRDKVESWFRLILQNQVKPVEFRGYNSDKEIRYIRVTASPVTEGETIVGVSGIISDITAWKESEKVKAMHTKEIQALLTLHLLTQESEEELLSYTLRSALEITGSYTGFIAFPSKNHKRLDYHFQSPDKTDLHTGQNAPDFFGTAGSWIWFECRATKKPVVINDFSLDPEHQNEDLPIIRLIAVPVLETDEVVAVLATANRDEPYTENNVNSLIALGNTLWNIIRKKRSEYEIKTALSQIARNMEQLATLNDTIRNPLTVIAAISDLIDPELKEEQMEAVRNIDSMIMMLDKGWIQSEKVRNFLLKHYRFSKCELDSKDPDY